VHRRRAAMPDPHHTVDGGSEQKRDIATLENLRHVGDEEAAVDSHEQSGDRAGAGEAPAPDFAYAMNRSTLIISMVSETAMP